MARTEFRFGVVCVVAVLAVYVIAGRSDEQALDDDALLALSKSHAIAYAEGEHHATVEWTQKVAAAYGQGQRDALASLRGRPEAMQVAQLCRAWRSVGDDE